MGVITPKPRCSAEQVGASGGLRAWGNVEVPPLPLGNPHPLPDRGYPGPLKGDFYFENCFGRKAARRFAGSLGGNFFAPCNLPCVNGCFIFARTAKFATATEGRGVTLP